jgi:hypothetical protein
MCTRDIVKTKLKHKKIAAICMYEAMVHEIPKPVAAAMYAAKHAGHFGMSATVAPGSTQPITERARRRKVAVLDGVELPQQLVICLLDS